MASGSSMNIRMRIKGSRPFCVSIIQGLGRANRSLTLPCDKPSIHSPNSLWLIENLLSSSLTFFTRSSVFMCEYLSNCSWETGGRTHLSGFVEFKTVLKLLSERAGDGVDDGRPEYELLWLLVLGDWSCLFRLVLLLLLLNGENLLLAREDELDED